MAWFRCGSGGDNGVNWELIWTNPNPSAGWSKETILEMDLTPYKYIAIRLGQHTGLDNVAQVHGSAIFDMSYLDKQEYVSRTLYARNANNMAYRVYNVYSDKITCATKATGMYLGQGTWYTESSYCIPVAIYGIKKDSVINETVILNNITWSTTIPVGYKRVLISTGAYSTSSATKNAIPTNFTNCSVTVLSSRSGTGGSWYTALLERIDDTLPITFTAPTDKDHAVLKGISIS